MQIHPTTATYVMLVFACSAPTSTQPDADPSPLFADKPAMDRASFACESPSRCGTPCGECSAGRWECSAATRVCRYPSDLDPTIPRPPADTGDRPVFHVDDYNGSPALRILRAGRDAAEVGGAVVLDQIYEVDREIRLLEGVMYTGGGLRRSCTPVGKVIVAAGPTDACVEVDDLAGYRVGTMHRVVIDDSFDGNLGGFVLTALDDTGSRLCVSASFGFEIPVGARIVRLHDLAGPPDTYSTGIVVDSVIFDGAERCNSEIHDWRFNNTMSLRGRNEIRNSIFYDTPSENLTICGSVVANNICLDLQGSFVHKSCSSTIPPVDLITGNYIENANLSGDAVMRHSEGLITFSANAGNIVATRNIYRWGSEGVFGLAGTNDENVTTVDDCYAHLPRLIEYYGGADQNAFDSRISP